jgi:Leucine-rich repeat (LRR) protein
MRSILYLIMVIILMVTGWMPVSADTAETGSSFSCTDVSEIPQIECEALVALYNSTGGAGWTHNDNWLISNIPSDWYGVTVISGTVSILSLSNNLLVGSLPPELSDLSSLTRLELWMNQINGSLPVELGQLTQLTYLDLIMNQITGSLPPEIGEMTSLVHLDISMNQLSGNIPPEIGNLINLENLML